MNEQERERHIKQNKICERLLLSCTSTYFCGKVAQEGFLFQGLLSLRIKYAPINKDLQ